MEIDYDTRSAFNTVAPHPDAFGRMLSYAFGPEAALNIKQFITDLGLPVPEKDGSYMEGSSGKLLFINRYGINLRVEREDNGEYQRVNNNRWILKPIATFRIGKAVIELVPGCEFETDRKNSVFLKEKLLKDGIDFWDAGVRNVVRLPISTSAFPNGMPVVGDRLSIRKLKHPAHSAKKKFPPKTEDPQTVLYAPLIKAFAAAWPPDAIKPDPEKLAGFWSLCRHFVAEGKLISGWNNYRDYAKGDSPEKAIKASRVAAAYDRLFETAPAPSSPAPGWQRNFT